jgi:hypothetical protein
VPLVACLCFPPSPFRLLAAKGKSDKVFLINSCFVSNKPWHIFRELLNFLTNLLQQMALGTDFSQVGK